MISLVCVFISLLLILKGGDLLVEASIWLAKKAKIPSVVVGATIVALATTFPEISVSLISGGAGLEEIAVNTALGSMVCNFALVLGLSFLISPSKVETNKLVGKIAFFVFALLTFFILSLDGRLGVIDAIILLLYFAVFMVYSILDSKNTKTKEEITKLPSWLITITQFVLSAFAIGYGANVLVSNIDELSQVLNINEGVLGVFIISVGTNIPEFVTTMSAIKLKNTEMGLGNIYGASLIDSTLLLAATTLSKGGAIIIPFRLLILTFISLVFITLIIAVPIIKNGKSSRSQGAILLFLFILYSILLIYAV